jgi:hypothetical protein
MRATSRGPTVRGSFPARIRQPRRVLAVASPNGRGRRSIDDRANQEPPLNAEQWRVYVKYLVWFFVLATLLALVVAAGLALLISSAASARPG